MHSEKKKEKCYQFALATTPMTNFKFIFPAGLPLPLELEASLATD